MAKVWKMHFPKNPRDQIFALCGVRLLSGFSTTDRSEVTCKNCKRKLLEPAR